MLGLRLDEPLALADVGGVVDEQALARLERLGFARVLSDARNGSSAAGSAMLALTARGRFLGGGVTADLLA